MVWYPVLKSEYTDVASGFFFKFKYPLKFHLRVLLSLINGIYFNFYLQSVVTSISADAKDMGNIEQ